MSTPPFSPTDKSADKPLPRPRGLLSDLNREATILGGLRSSLSHGKRSMLSIQSGTNSILEASRRTMAAGRVETFQEASERLGVTEGDLSLIHNQIVFQAYVALAVALIAFGMALQYFIFSRQIAASVLSIVIGVSSVFFAVQSSVQTLQIRRKQLGLLNDWLVMPGEWFPRRLTQLRHMSRSDPLRHPIVVQSLSRRARRHIMVAATAIGFGVAIQIAGIGASSGSWPMLLYILSTVFLSMGIRLSFEVFRRRMGLHCDALMWVLAPSDWIPAIHDARTNDLLKFMKSTASADGAQPHEEIPHG